MSGLFHGRYLYLTIAALFLLSIALLNILLHIIHDYSLVELLWFCNIASFIGAIGILFRNKIIVSGTLIAALPAQALWIIDFFYQLVGVEGLGRTGALFESDQNFFVFGVSVVLHTTLIPILFYAVYKLGFVLYRGIVFALVIYGHLLLVLSYLFTPTSLNINCVLFPCDVSFSEVQDQIYLGEYASIQYLSRVFLFWTLSAIVFFIISYIYNTVRIKYNH